MKKLNWLVCAGFVASLMCAVEVSAATYTWVGTQAGADYNVPSNWSPEGMPSRGGGDTAKIDTLPGATVYSGTSGAHGLTIGNVVGQEGMLTVLGGSLNATGLDIANVAGGIGTVNVHTGFHTVNYLCPGFRGHGTLNLYGGEFLVATQVRIAYYGTGSTGIANLYDGIIDAPSVSIAREKGTAAIMVKDGVLLVRGTEANMLAHLAYFQGFIDSGAITAAEGYELVLEYNGVLYPGKTALYALRNDLNMIPYNKSTVRQSTDQLQWTLPDPNDPVTPSVVTCDVYFGTDPNVVRNPKIVNKQAVESVSVTLGFGIEYYWMIDVYDSSKSATVPIFRSRVFTFNTFNVPPVVDAGAEIQTWLAGGPRVVQLGGSVADPDHAPDSATQQWTVLSEPDPLTPAVISNPSVLNPTVTLNAVGTYVLQLEGTDGEYIVADTMQIVVYPDACTHASQQPGFAWFVHDSNRDCNVNMLDFAELAAQWLEWNYSIE